MEEEEHTSAVQRLLASIFFGNYFYGLCAVALMAETAVQLKIPFDGISVYCLAFVATVLFYNYPYARHYASPSHNPRIQWYIRNHRWVIWNQVFFTLVLLGTTGYFAYRHASEIVYMGTVKWTLLLVFPVVGATYYGIHILSKKYSLRQVGWLKPFVIGFVWAGMATVYPLLWHDVLHVKPYAFTFLGSLLFVKNLMFTAVLAIMFDIKDYTTDSKNKLNTLVVKMGLQKTIGYVLLPLPILGLLTFISYAVLHHFSIPKMVLIMIPFFSLLLAATSLRKPRTLLYYLVVIDGLFLVKAFFGIVAMLV